MSGPLPAALAPIARPASWLYAAAIRRRNRRFDRGVGVERLPVPVISIGNLSVGGTGKTPVVQWTARRLAARGLRPAIALRGYASGGDPAASDEAREHAEAVPEALVLADPRRAEAVRAALGRGERIDAVVLDDGFQHRRLARDLDVALIDARAGTLADRVLPAGWLREPASGLRRAGAIVVTYADGVDAGLAAAIEGVAGRPPTAWTRHAWTGLRTWAAGAVPTPETAGAARVSGLAGRAVAVMAGVARPAGVVAMATAAGARVVHVEPVRDHQRYDAASRDAALARAADAGAEAVLVTRKDRVKLASLPAPPASLPPLVEPVLSLVFLEGEALLAAAVDAAVDAATGAAADDAAGH